MLPVWPVWCLSVWVPGWIPSPPTFCPPTVSTPKKCKARLKERSIPVSRLSFRALKSEVHRCISRTQAPCSFRGQVAHQVAAAQASLIGWGADGLVVRIAAVVLLHLATTCWRRTRVCASSLQPLSALTECLRKCELHASRFPGGCCGSFANGAGAGSQVRTAIMAPE